MAMLTRDAILGATDIKRELVAVPEWGGDVYVGMMNGAARDMFDAQIVNKKTGSQNIRAKLAAATVQDEEGTLMFSIADIEALGKKSAAALQRVYEVAVRLNRMGADDVEELGKS